MGTPEAADSVRLANLRKPVLAYADGLVCSAAYWIASQASAIYAMPSAEVGSIGAYMAIMDYTRAAEMEGIRVEMFRSGKHKGMGYPGTSLRDDQREMLQAQVMDIAAKFKAAVRSGRGKPIDDECMQGQSFCVEAAAKCGLIDQVSDFDTVVRDAVTTAQIRGKTRRETK